MEPLKTNSEVQVQPYGNTIEDFAPDKIKPKTYQDAANRAVVPGFQNRGAGVSPTSAINSANFTNGTAGWGFASNGDAQVNGNRIVSAHFTPILGMKGNTLYISDGTSPNGTLTGATGDVVFHGDGGKIYFCIGGTTWTAPA